MNRIKTTTNNTSTFPSRRSSATPFKQLKIHSKFYSSLNKLAMLCLLVISFLFISGNHTFAMGATTENYDGAGSSEGEVLANGTTPFNFNGFTYQIITVSGAVASTDILYTQTWGNVGSAAISAAGDFGALITVFKITKTDSSVFDTSSLWMSSVGQAFTVTGYNNNITTGQSVNVAADFRDSKTLDFVGVDELRFEGPEIVVDFDDLTYTLAPANATPTPTAPSAPSVTEDDTNVALNNDIDVADSDGDDQTLTFTITGGTLVIGTSGITFGGSGNGSASYTAAGTLAEINTALDAATFTPTANLSGTNAATISFATNDGTVSSSAASVSFDIAAVNDEPTLTATGTNPTFTEDGSAAVVFNSAFASTIESGQTLSALTITITNVNNGSSEILNVDGTAIVLTHGTSDTTASNSLSYSVSVVGTTATISLSGGTLSTSSLQTLINTISYQNNSNTPNTSNRVVTLTSLTDSGGTANSGDDTAALAVASTVTVIAANDAPSISINGSTLAYTEDNAAIQIDPTATVYDVDGDTDWNGGQIALEIQANDEAADEISISDTDGDGITITISGSDIFANGTDIGNLSHNGGVVTGAAQLGIFFISNASNAIVQEVFQSLRYRNTSDNPGTGNRLIVIAAFDANSVADTVSRTISVTSLDNDAPTITTNNALNINEGATASISAASHLSAADVDDDDATLVFTITTNTLNGALKKSGTTLEQNDTFTQADLTAGNMSYVHDGTNTDSDSFIFKVSDNNSNELTNQTFSFVVTTHTQTASLALPASSSTDNSDLNVDFTLPEAASPGTLKMTFSRTGGTADANSPHILTFATGFESADQHTTTLDGTDLSSNANVESVNTDGNDALVDGATYSVKLEYQDEVLSAAASITSTSFHYENITQLPTLLSPATGSSDNASLAIDFTLPEAASPGTAKMTFTRTGGTADPNAPHILTFAAGFETAAQHIATLNGSDLSSDANVASVNTDGNDTLVDGAIYSVRLEYQDEILNAAASITSTSFHYDNITKQPTLASPATSSSDNASLAVDFTLPEPASPGTAKMTFTRTGGAADPNSPHILTFAAGFETAAQHIATLNGSDLSSNGNVTSVSSDANDALVEGAIYSVKLEYQDAVDNPPSSYTNTGFTYDLNYPATITTQAVSSISTTTATGNGNITDLGYPNPTQHGVCWNTTGSPTTADSNTKLGAASSTGASTSNITGLTPGTTYYVRAYATNSVGTSYASQVSFTTGVPSIAFNTTNSNNTEALIGADLQVELSAISSSTVTVDYTVTGTAAGSGTDYTLANGTLTIAAGETNGNITIASIVDDTLDENNETVIVTLSNPTNATLGTNKVHTYTINDNDATPTVTFTSASQSSVGESGALTLTAQLSAASSRDITVPFTVSAASSATVGTDYAISSSPITIPTGSTTANITITIAADALDEDNETIIINMGTPVNATQGATTSHTATITDDDIASFAVTQTAGSTLVAESASTDTFTVVLNAQPASNVVFNIGSDDTGEATVDKATLTFTATNWNTPQTVTVIGVDDDLVDGDQTASVTIAVNDAASDDVFDTLATQTVTVTTTDNDVAGFTVIQTAGSTLVAESASTDTFTVVLNKQPASNVVFNIGSDDTGEATVDKATLTFTATNWNTPQTVTVIGVDDDLVDGDQTASVTIAVNDAASDDVFDTLATQTVTVTTTDNDVAGFTVIQTAGSTLVAESASTDTFTVVLNAQPASNVVFNIGSDDTGEATVDKATLTFTTTNWNTPQTVTVIGVDDDLVDGDQTASVTIAVNDAASDDVFDTLATQTVTVTTTDNDVAGFTVIQTAGSTLVAESASTDTFTVVLNTQPASNVVFNIGSDDTGEATVDKATLTFTTTNWNTPQTVTVIGVDDDLVDGDQTASVTIAVNDAASDDVFDTLATQTVTVTTTDNDVAGFTVIQTAGSTLVAESASTDTFTVVLNTQPASNVVFNIGSDDTGEATVDKATLTFTTTNWNTPQTVTVTGVDDDLVDGDQTASVTIAVNDAASDDVFDTLATQTVTVTTTDNDVAGFTVTQTAGSTLVAESASTDTFTVVLNTQPASNVVFNIGSDDTGEATVDKATLTFTTTNWNTPQTVTVTGVDDDLVDGDQTASVTIAVNDAASDDVFDALANKTVSVVTTDNDVAGFTVIQTAGSTLVAESASTDTFTVVLNKQPASNVVFNIGSDDTGEATVDKATLTFTTTNWNTPQTVTVIGVDDDLVDGDQTASVTIAVNDAASDDVFDALANKTVSVVTTDNDVAGFTVIQTAGSTLVAESASTDTFTVVLNKQPASNVVFNIGSDDTGEATVDKATLTFTTTNWNTPQTVTVTGVDDDLVDGDQTASVTIAVNDAASDDVFDTLATQTVTVTTTDNDVAGFTVIQTAGSTLVAESASTDTFTVVLNAQPASNVVFNIGSDDTGEATVDKATLTFTATNWNTPQTVTVIGVDDDLVDGDQTASVTIAVNDAASDDVFDALANKTVSVVTTDNDVAGFTVIQTAGSTLVAESASTDTFTVVLNAQPASNVVFNIGSDDTGEATVDKATLTFTATNWNTPQNVTVIGVDDDLVDGDQTASVTIAVNDAASDDVFDALANKTVSVVTTDNDVAGFTVIQTAGSTLVAESASTDTFTVVLNAQPASNVVFNIGSDDTGEATVDKATLTFTTTNWNTPQTVTVIGVDDDLVDGDQTASVTIAVNDAASNDNFDALATQTVTVTTIDNDVAGFTISESGGTTEVSELATTDTFTLVLDSRPSSNVVLTITGHDASEIIAAPALVTFTAANWNRLQTVTVTGVDDDEIDGIKITTVTVAVQDTVSDAAFDPLADQTISVVNRDNDAALVVASPIADVAVVDNIGNTTINLSSTFENPNDSTASIVKSVFANSNSSLVTASISGDTLTLSYKTDQLGAATITVRATSNGKSVDDSFDVTVQTLQEMTFEKIQQYAATSDASLLTVAELVTAGMVEVDIANLSAYKQAISAQTEIADLATLQTLIYQVNAMERIKNYALSSDASPLTIDELISAGVHGSIAEHLDIYQQEIAALESLTDLAALQALIDQVHALVTIQGYVEQVDAAEMKLAELQLTGTEDLYFYNLPAYRLSIELTDNIDSLLALQELIAAANLASALDQGAAAVTLPAIVDEDDMLDQLKEDEGYSMPVADDEGDEQQVVLCSQLPTYESVDQDSEEGRITFTNTFDGSQLSTVIDEQGFIEQQVQTADGSESGVASMWLDILAQTSAVGVMTLQATIPYTDSYGVTIPLEITTTLQPTGMLQAQVQRNPTYGESTTSTLVSEGFNGGAVIQADGSLLMMLETALSGNQVSATGHVDTAGRVDGIVVQGGVETHVNSLLPGSDVTVLDDGWLQLRSVRVIDFTAVSVHGDQYDNLYYADDTEHRVLYANADITEQGVLWTGFTIIHNGYLEQQYDTLATTADSGFSNSFPAQSSATITTADNGDPRLTITTTLQVPLQF